MSKQSAKEIAPPDAVLLVANSTFIFSLQSISMDPSKETRYRYCSTREWIGWRSEHSWQAERASSLLLDGITHIDKNLHGRHRGVFAAFRLAQTILENDNQCRADGEH